MIVDSLKESWMFVSSSVVILWFASRKLETWLLFDASMGIMTSLSILSLPQNWLELLFEDVVPAHVEAGRMIGLYLGSMNLYYLLARKSKDPTVHTSYMWARMLGLTLQVMHEAYCVSGFEANVPKSKFYFRNVPHLHALGALLHLYHTLRMKSWGGYAQPNNKLNLYQKVDFCIIFIIAMGMSLFPDSHVRYKYKTENPDEFLLTAFKFAGVWMVANTILSARSGSFLNINDRKIFFTARVLLISGHMILVFSEMLLYGEIIQPFYNIAQLAVLTLWHINSFLGLMMTRKVKEKNIKIK